MNRVEIPHRIFACSLAGLAGFTDAIGFIRSGGFFVSFMSGNSTRLGVGLAQRSHAAALAGLLICTFLLGVIAGSLLGGRARAHRAAIILASVAVLLAAAAYLNDAGGALLSLVVLAFAMGAENTVFELGGDVRVGLTYITGDLVRAGSGIASSILGRNDDAWPSYLLLWGAFLCGTIVGAIACGPPPNLSLWAASAAALLLALGALRLK